MFLLPVSPFPRSFPLAEKRESLNFDNVRSKHNKNEKKSLRSLLFAHTTDRITSCRIFTAIGKIDFWIITSDALLAQLLRMSEGWAILVNSRRNITFRKTECARETRGTIRMAKVISILNLLWKAAWWMKVKYYQLLPSIFNFVFQISSKKKRNRFVEISAPRGKEHMPSVPYGVWRNTRK